jgi:toxin ParE1/3/4
VPHLPKSTEKAANGVEAISSAVFPKNVDSIVAHCETFQTFPERGHSRNDLFDGLRVTGFRKRISIAFLIVETEVVIVGIFYAGANYESQLKSK